MPVALAAAGLAALVLTGCEKAAAPAASSAASYMDDEKFMGRLEGLRAERQDLLKTRAKLVREMQAMVDAKRAELAGADDAAVKAALEKDPAWVSLYRRCKDVNVAVAEARGRSMETVRERLAPQAAPDKKISK